MDFSNGLLKGLLVISMSLLVSACGGSGGGGGPAAVTYTGATTQAVITTANAKSLTIDAYQLGGPGTAIGFPVGVATQPTEQQGTDASRVDLHKLGTSLKSAVIKALAAKKQTVRPVGVSISDCIDGLYGGWASYTLAVNDNTPYDFSGSITFNSYSEKKKGTDLFVAH